MGVLIGHRGETLDSVQYLTSLVVNKNSDKYKRVLLDTENYRSKREETLKRLAKRLANKVYKTGRNHEPL
jgi:spoIIIJ-associated protein